MACPRVSKRRHDSSGRHPARDCRSRINGEQRFTLREPLCFIDAAYAVRFLPRSAGQTYCVGIHACAKRFVLRYDRAYRTTDRAVRAGLRATHPRASRYEVLRFGIAERESYRRRHQWRCCRFIPITCSAGVEFYAISHGHSGRLSLLGINTTRWRSSWYVRLPCGHSRSEEY